MNDKMRQLTFFLIGFFLLFAHTAYTEDRVTEGIFAVKLATRLKMAENPSEEKAVALLTAATLQPEEGWRVDEKVTEKRLIRIQASIYTLLNKLLRNQKVPVPPTLSLQVLEPPYAPQTIMFSDDYIKKGEATEGQFAQNLVEKLGLGKKLSIIDSIALLSSVGIKPDTEWKPEERASDLFGARIQASILNVIKSVLQELQIPVPPTFTVNIKLEN
jgi:hypothetical protein